MNNATLMYVINSSNGTKNLRLENKPLLYLDNFTSGFKNEEDFLKNYYGKEKIDKFIKENGNRDGELLISYAKSVNDKETIKPLFNLKEEIVLNENPYADKFTEVEKARKLLFNSKNQLFTKLILSNKTLDKQLNKYIDLTEEENKYICNYGIRTLNINNKHYVSFKALFEYRTKTDKLGYIRNVYQEMLNVLKTRLVELDDATFYFYNRQLRIIINKYNELMNEITINNLKIKKIKINCKYIINKSNLKFL